MDQFTWPPSRDFMTALQEIRDIKTHLSNSATNNGRNLWDGVGSLCQFQLLADMHAAGLVDTPTAEHVGQVVASLRAGARDGLIATGHITGSSTATATQRGFVQFFDDVTSSLTEDQIQLFGWNPIVAEHTLCKLLRMLKRNKYVF